MSLAVKQVNADSIFGMASRGITFHLTLLWAKIYILRSM